MKKTQFQTIKVNSFTTDVYEMPAHSHTYYEIIYIFGGSGLHHINHSVLNYEQGDLFILSPEDLHYFKVIERTEFLYVKLTESFFEEVNASSNNFSISFSPSYIMKNAQLKELKLQFPKPYDQILNKTFTSIKEYAQEKDVTKSMMIYFLVLSVFELIRESALKMQIRVEGMRTKEDDLITYIHQNIYYPDALKVEKIAQVFNLSENYFSTYFKRKFALTYNEYVKNYKMQLIEKRISSNILNFKSIASEFGFTDLSHFNNFFKQHKKMTPTEYRKTNILV